MMRVHICQNTIIYFYFSHLFLLLTSLTKSRAGGCVITCKDGLEETYDGCIIAAHAPEAANMLGKQATYDELRILGAFQYAYSDIFLHHDDNLMPKNRGAWCSRNFLGTTDDKACITYWLNNAEVFPLEIKLLK